MKITPQVVWDSASLAVVGVIYTALLTEAGVVVARFRLAIVLLYAGLAILLFFALFVWRRGRKWAIERSRK